MIACELHPEAFLRLKANLGSDRRAKAIALDGYAALKAFVPPPERRGLVLIDPPFEDIDEFARLSQALPAAARKWATGVFMLWYPVKDRSAAAAFAQSLGEGLVASGVKSTLRMELQIDVVRPLGAMARCGLIIANPPFVLDAEAKLILPSLSERLGVARADHMIEWLSRT
jgi:23S rRNA (adenine2030-N6)-methyltransferase